MKFAPAVRTDTIIGLVVAAACVVILAWVIPAETSRATAFGMPPALMPTVTISAALGLAVLLAVAGTLRDSTEAPTEDTLELPNAPGLACAGMILACILIMQFAGLLAGGILTVAGFMLVMGERRPVRILVIALAVPGAIQLLLGSALRVG